MNVYDHPLYREDIRAIASLELPWNKLENATMMLSGATGLIGSCLVDVLMHLNEQGLHCKIYGIGRNRDKATERFAYCRDSDLFTFCQQDIAAPLVLNGPDRVDYVLHLASNTHPLQYAADPIGTITTNVFGTYQLLEFAAAHQAKRCAIASSNEIYGENRGDLEFFDESYCGYIDSNTLRAGYPESKRCSEALCQAYIKQKELDIVIPRLTRSYGPTMQMSDTKAISQFIKKGLGQENIVLKSAGTQYYSYTYAADAVAGLLTVLLCGTCGEAYNIADEASDIMLKDLAQSIANYVGTKVVFELPDAAEATGYSKATKARLDGAKLKSLGWKPRFEIDAGIRRTLSILQSCRQG